MHYWYNTTLYVGIQQLLAILYVAMNIEILSPIEFSRGYPRANVRTSSHVVPAMMQNKKRLHIFLCNAKECGLAGITSHNKKKIMHYVSSN